jgi:peroxiredoxin
MVTARAYARVRRPSSARNVGAVLAVLVLASPVLGIGVFEGVYNHLAKNVLFFAGLPHHTLLSLFPPPTYELPNDFVFEVSGIAQIIPAAFAGLAAVRFIAALRGRAARCTRPACTRRFALRCLASVTGELVEVPDPRRVVHLQLRRFAGCPVCNLHLRSFVRRHDELEAAGIREVVVFHSSTDELRAHVSELPFAVIADPDKRLYAELGVSSARRALLDPRAWGPILLAVARSLVAVVRGRERAPSLTPRGGRFGMPADFLIGPDGRVLACKHGEHAYDQWARDEVLAIAAQLQSCDAGASTSSSTRPVSATT